MNSDLLSVTLERCLHLCRQSDSVYELFVQLEFSRSITTSKVFAFHFFVEWAEPWCLKATTRKKNYQEFNWRKLTSFIFCVKLKFNAILHLLYVLHLVSELRR